jgi:hypothetical protein
VNAVTELPSTKVPPPFTVEAKQRIRVKNYRPLMGWARTVMDQEKMDTIKRPTAGFCHATKFIRLNFFLGGGGGHPKEIVTCSNCSCCFKRNCQTLTANRLLRTPDGFTWTGTQQFVHKADLHVPYDSYNKQHQQIGLYNGDSVFLLWAINRLTDWLNNWLSNSLTNYLTAWLTK